MSKSYPLLPDRRRGGRPWAGHRGLVAYYNGGLTGVRQTSDADLAYLPANAAAVGYADVRTIMSSEFSQKLRQILPTGEEKEKLQAELGVDIERDIDSVAAAYVADLSLRRTPSSLSGVVSTPARSKRSPPQHGATAADYRGIRLLTMPSPVMRRETPTWATILRPAAWPSSRLASWRSAKMSGSSSRLMRRATGRRHPKEHRVDDNRERRARGQETPGSSVSSTPSRATRTFRIRSKSHIPPVDLFAVSAHVNGGLRGAIRADARDETAAAAAPRRRARRRGGRAADGGPEPADGRHAQLAADYGQR